MLTVSDIPRIQAALTPAVNAYLLATAYAKFERERVNVIYSGILAKSPGYLDDEGKRITSPRDAWRIADKRESEIYYAECQDAIDAAGYKLPRGHCPALVAENVQRDAAKVLIDAAGEFFAVTDQQLWQQPNSLQVRQEYIDLLVGLVVSSPDYVSPAIKVAV